MKKISLLVLLLMAGTFSAEIGGMALRPDSASAAPNPKGDPPFDSEIGIWYTVWWDDQGPYASHWPDWSRYEPVLGHYASDNEDIIRTHMTWMKQSGIDFVILDDTNGHFNDGGNIAEHIDKIFEVVEHMPEGTAPQLCLAIGGALYSSGLAAHQQEVDLVYERYAQSPVYYHWKGKPLLITYTTRNWFEKHDDDRFTIRWATGRASEGANVAPETGLWGWVFDQEVPSTEMVGVMPGWDTAHLGRGTTPIPREGGDLYTEMWLNALKKNPEAVIIVGFNDFAEETAIEAAVPTAPDAETWTDYYGQPTPDWYEQITRGYASLKYGFQDGYSYREEGKNQIYTYQNGQWIKESALPHGRPVIVVPKGYLNGTYHPPKDPPPGHQQDKWLVADLLQSWVNDFKGITSNWSYETVLENGQTYQGLTNGAEFYDLIWVDQEAMFRQMDDESQHIVRRGFKAHPAWNGANGWAIAKVNVDLPQEKRLYLTLYPGKVNTVSDGITLTVLVNGQPAGYSFASGAAGWKEQMVVDLSDYAGQTVEIAFKVGWGQEELGGSATTGWDAFLLGDPVIVSKLN